MRHLFSIPILTVNNNCGLQLWEFLCEQTLEFFYNLLYNSWYNSSKCFYFLSCIHKCRKNHWSFWPSVFLTLKVSGFWSKYQNLYYKRIRNAPSSWQWSWYECKRQTSWVFFCDIFVILGKFFACWGCKMWRYQICEVLARKGNGYWGCKQLCKWGTIRIDNNIKFV